jgi:hypothetical protein
MNGAPGSLGRRDRCPEATSTFNSACRLGEAIPVHLTAELGRETGPVSVVVKRGLITES